MHSHLQILKPAHGTYQSGQQMASVALSCRQFALAKVLGWVYLCGSLLVHQEIAGSLSFI